MKKILLLTILLLPGYCFAQMHVSFSTGFASFSMQDMKQHQAELKAQFPVEVKIIKSFPAFWCYDLAITGELSDRFRIGAALGFTSTGGRMSYKDYSGEVECNQMLKTWVLAAQSDVLLNPYNKKFPVLFTLKAGATFSRYDLDLSVELNDTRDIDAHKFHSANLFIEPGFKACKPIGGPLSAFLTAGYNLNVIKGKQRLSDNTDMYLLNDAGTEIHLDWSGFRAGVGVSLTF